MIAAGIVVFRPDRDVLLALVGAVADQVGTVLVFVNREIDAETLARLEDAGPKLRLLRADENLGVGEALNVLALQAALLGADRLVLFDQDSRPGPATVDRLGAAFDQLAAEGRRPAVVGPAIAAPADAAVVYKPPRYWRRRDGGPACGGARPVQFVITSGSLLDLAAFRAVGPFRADYFIDGIDVEWCLRAWSRGWSCWCAEEVAMAHTIGGGSAKLAPGLSTPLQRDFRMYAYMRNAAHTWRLAHVPAWWKLGSAGYMALQGGALIARRGFEPAFARLLWRAVRDGLAGRLGPPEGVAGAGPPLRLP